MYQKIVIVGNLGNDPEMIQRCGICRMARPLPVLVSPPTVVGRISLAVSKWTKRPGSVCRFGEDAGRVS